MRCYQGPAVHDFPIKDETGVCCPEHGVTLLWHGDPITEDESRGDSPTVPQPQDH